MCGVVALAPCREAEVNVFAEGIYLHWEQSKCYFLDPGRNGKWKRERRLKGLHEHL